LGGTKEKRRKGREKITKGEKISDIYIIISSAVSL
jgi:hypothetical protein